MDRKAFMVEDILEWTNEELPKYSDYRIVKWEQFQVATSTLRWLIVLEYDEFRNYELDNIATAIESLKNGLLDKLNDIDNNLVDVLKRLKKDKKQNNNSDTIQSDEEFKAKAKESWAGQGNKNYFRDGD